jgi:hypothetical protein
MFLPIKHRLSTVALLLLATITATTAGAADIIKTASGLPAEGKLAPFLGAPKLDITEVHKGGRFPNIVVALDGSLVAVFSGVKVKRSEAKMAGQPGGLTSR